MRIKVCGMRDRANVEELAALRPDYVGFIFYAPSPRFCPEPPLTKEGIQRVGVFVDAPQDEIVKAVEEHKLDLVQLHGKESPLFCRDLKKALEERVLGNVELIKAFSVGAEFDFEVLRPYLELCDYFLFDTKGPAPGGNGQVFDWKIMEDYPWEKPFFLSGGIGLNELSRLKQFSTSKAARYCLSLDVNSKFETTPGLKNIKELKAFFDAIKA